MYQNSFVYIHVDAKYLDIISDLLADERILIAPEHFDIKWRDYTQIQVNNYMMKFASQQRFHDYYSLHSGADLLIRPIVELMG